MPVTPKIKARAKAKPVVKPLTPKTSAKIATKAKTSAPILPLPAQPKTDLSGAYAGMRNVYDGPSPVINVRKSRTAINAEFNAYPNATLTARDEAFIRGLRNEAKRGQFQRLNLDAGNLRRAIERGFVRPVNVTGADTAAHTYVLAEKAFPKQA